MDGRDKILVTMFWMIWKSSGRQSVPCFWAIIRMVHTLNWTHCIRLLKCIELNWGEGLVGKALAAQACRNDLKSLGAIFKMKAGSSAETCEPTLPRFPGPQFSFHYSSLCALVYLFIGFSVYWRAIILAFFHL